MFPPTLCHPLSSRPAASVCALTKSEPVPGDLPLRGVVGQVFTLLIQRHLARVHDDGQIACLDVRRVDLKFRVERRSERRQPVRGRRRKEERKKGNLKKDWKSGVSFAKLPPVRIIFHPYIWNHWTLKSELNIFLIWSIIQLQTVTVSECKQTLIMQTLLQTWNLH